MLPKNPDKMKMIVHIKGGVKQIYRIACYEIYAKKENKWEYTPPVQRTD
jgi:hypothetical protein